MTLLMVIPVMPMAFIASFSSSNLQRICDNLDFGHLNLAPGLAGFATGTYSTGTEAAIVYRSLCDFKRQSPFRHTNVRQG